MVFAYLKCGKSTAVQDHSDPAAGQVVAEAPRDTYPISSLLILSSLVLTLPARETESGRGKKGSGGETERSCEVRGGAVSSHRSTIFGSARSGDVSGDFSQQFRRMPCHMMLHESIETSQLLPPCHSTRYCYSPLPLHSRPRTHQEGGIASSEGEMPPGPSTERQALLVSTECCSVAALSESRSREG